jgi:hypothetical protein
MRQRRYGSSHLLADLARCVPAAELAQLEREPDTLILAA